MVFFFFEKSLTLRITFIVYECLCISCTVRHTLYLLMSEWLFLGDLIDILFSPLFHILSTNSYWLLIITEVSNEINWIYIKNIGFFIHSINFIEYFIFFVKNLMKNVLKKTTLKINHNEFHYLNPSISPNLRLIIIFR